MGTSWAGRAAGRRLPRSRGPGVRRFRLDVTILPSPGAGSGGGTRAQGRTLAAAGQGPSRGTGEGAGHCFMAQRMGNCSTHCVQVHGDPGAHPSSASGWAHNVEPSPRARSSPRSLRCRAGRPQGEGTPGLLDSGRAFSTEKLKSQNQTKSQACTLPLGPGPASGAVPSRGRYPQTGSPTHTGGASSSPVPRPLV